MEKFITATGKTIDLAIAAALEQLGMDRDSVSVEVLDNPKSGFLGIEKQAQEARAGSCRSAEGHCARRSGRSTRARNGAAEIRAEIRAEARGKAAAAQTRA